MTTIYLVRHAETIFNQKNKLQGLINGELSEKGLKQANLLRQKFNSYDVDFCYCSPLLRTMQTAFTLVGDRCLILKDERLIERNLGQLEGKSRKLYDVEKYWNYDLNSNYLGVEKIQDLYQRCEEFLNDLLKQHLDQKILIVSHSAVIKCLYYILNDENRRNVKKIKVPNCYFKEIVL